MTKRDDDVALVLFIRQQPGRCGAVSYRGAPDFPDYQVGRAEPLGLLFLTLGEGEGFQGRGWFGSTTEEEKAPAKTERRERERGSHTYRGASR